jgi:hypothetical protein
MVFQPTAKIIADSVNPNGDRLTTIVCTYHRFIHSEVLTHRVFSRNSSSSRAIPVQKMIEKVKAENVMPLFWGKNQKGMSAKKEHNAPILNHFCDYKTTVEYSRESAWENAKVNAIMMAEAYADAGYHKQIVNRILEPFSSITTIITATEYQNFFKQRCHPNAQPEIQALAIAMMEAYQESKPVELDWNDWHTPFVSDDEATDQGLNLKARLMVATGRSARVSYLTHLGVRDVTEDIRLHNDLKGENPPHLSPFEHCAVAQIGAYANFTGWQSYRSEIEKPES